MLYARYSTQISEPDTGTFEPDTGNHHSIDIALKS